MTSFISGVPEASFLYTRLLLEFKNFSEINRESHNFAEEGKEILI